MRDTDRLTDSLAAVRASCAPVAHVFTGSPWRGRIRQPAVADFAFGNPQEMPLPGFVAAPTGSPARPTNRPCAKWSRPRSPTPWHCPPRPRTSHSPMAASAPSR